MTRDHRELSFLDESSLQRQVRERGMRTAGNARAGDPPSTRDPRVWSRGVSWLFIAKAQGLQYGVDRIEGGLPFCTARYLLEDLPNSRPAARRAGFG